MEYPRRVQVQHQGSWLAGTLLAARRDGHGPWRGLVTYTDPTCTLSWYYWRPAQELRPAQSVPVRGGPVEQGARRAGMHRPAQ